MEEKKEIHKQVLVKEHRWYAISVNANQEEAVIENLKERIKRMSLDKDIKDFYMPIVQELVVKNWKKIVKEKKLYPWYLFINTTMNDKVWYVIRNTPWVRLIIWAETHPVPLTDAEFDNIVFQVEKKNSKLSTRTNIKLWDVVLLRDTNFKWMKWTVREIDDLRGHVIVMVDFMWRATPVTLWFDMVVLE